MGSPEGEAGGPPGERVGAGHPAHETPGAAYVPPAGERQPPGTAQLPSDGFHGPPPVHDHGQPPGPFVPPPPGAGYLPLSGAPYPSADPLYPPPGVAPPPAAPSRSGLFPPPDPPRPTHRWGIGAYLVVEAIFLVTSLLIGFTVLGDGTPSAGALMVALLVPTGLAAGAALLITRLRGNGPWIDLGLQWSWRDAGLGLAFGFGGLAVTIPASVVYVAIAGPDATTAVGDLFDGIDASPFTAVVIMLIVVFVAPLCEEIVYRGLLWGGLLRLGAGRWTAFAVTTLLFALAHFEFSRTPLLLIVAVPIALARLYTGRLLASVVAHQVNNLLPGVVLMLALLGTIPMGG